MSDYYFTTISGTEVATQIQVRCPTLDTAKSEARRILARLVADRFVDDPCEMVSVEIFDNAGGPLTELRLIYQEIDK